jgi:hypothetical protein
MEIQRKKFKKLVYEKKRDWQSNIWKEAPRINQIKDK